jgi:regulator of replication initiation timing
MDDNKLQNINVSFNKGHMKIDDIQWLIHQVDSSREEIRGFKTKTWYKVHEENLRLAEENAALKKELEGMYQ